VISEKTINDIREKTDIVSVISDFVPLKKRGRNFIGLCPFHSEKTPSFTVSQEKQMFHCFGCGEGGNVFTFLMKTNNLEFTDAVQYLADKLGYQIEKTKSENFVPKSEKEKILSIIKLAAKYFENMLVNSLNGKFARDYIEKRKFSSDTAKLFKIGYAPEGWNGLTNYLIERGLSATDIYKAGLSIQKEDGSGYYDRFRNRLMFTICDLMGREIAFGGRTLGTDDAKYINSSESPVYSKGNTLFGLNLSRDAIKALDFTIVVEGYVDLITCYQNGIKNIVATLGTALTENQARLLARFSLNAVLVFDSDNAGSIATGRGIDVLRDAGINVKIASCQTGKDPDEEINKSGVENFKKSINDAMPWLEYKIRSMLKKYSINEIEGKSKAIKDISHILGTEKDAVIQSEYAKMVSVILHVDPEIILSQMRQQKYYSNKSTGSLRRVVEKPTQKLIMAEQILIKLMVENAIHIEKIKNEIFPEDFTDDSHRMIARMLFDGSSYHLIQEALDDAGKKIFSGIMVGELPECDDEKYVLDCIRTVKVHQINDKLARIKKEIDIVEKEGDLESLKELFKQFQKYSEIIRTL